MISVCVPVYRHHGAPNALTLAEAIPEALDGEDGELIIALNGISAAELSLPPEVRCVDLGVNRGVAPGWNAAARAATGDILVFANDDVIPGSRSLALLAEVLRRRPEAGVVGPVGTRWDLSGPHHLQWVETERQTPGELVACDVLSGFAFATRRETFERAGGFDERYAPCSYEELDFCTTVRAQLGMECYAVAGVAIAHEYAISVARPWTRVRYDGRSETLRSIHRRNRRHFQQKWAGKV